MSQYRPGDEGRTSELIRALRRLGPSWLRHRAGAACVDRLLVFGATADQLAQCRDAWQAHIRHLRTEHHLVVEQPNDANGGLYRLLG